MNVLPIFSSHYSLGGASLLTLEEPGKSKAGSPISVFDLASEGGLKEVILVDDRIDGFLQAYKTAKKMGVKLCFGLKLRVCSNMLDKTDKSLTSESNVILFAKNTDGYHDLLRIQSRAAGEGSHEGLSRADWELVASYWTTNLLLALPFFSSFISKNVLTFDRIVPRLPPDVGPISVFREVGSQLPFESLIAAAVERYVAATPGAVLVPTKSIYYRSRSDLEPYIVMRAIAIRGASFDKPKVEHLSSPEFCFESYRELVAAAIVSPDAALATVTL